MQEQPSQRHTEDYCGRKPGVTSGFPFGEEHRVFKVGGGIFAVVGVEGAPAKVTFKTEPDLTTLLRGQYPCVRPARYWSTLTCDGTVPGEEVVDLLDTSYDIVFDGLKKSDRGAVEATRDR